MMFSVENLREYCRTCLVKLETNTGDHNSSETIHIKKFPDIDHLIQVCLEKSALDDDSLSLYAPFLCRSCFDKWLDFLRHYQLAVKTDEEIRKVLENKVLKAEKLDEKYGKTKQNEYVLTSKYFINNETVVGTHEVEEYETESPFYMSSSLNNQINNIKHITLKDDPTKASKQFKRNSTESVQLVIQPDKDVCSSSSDRDEDFVSDPKNKKEVQIKNAKKIKRTRKSLCALKKTHNSKKPLMKVSEKHLFLKKGNEYIQKLSDNGTKKVRYQCEQCNKYFWEKNKYDGHMKQIHEGIRRPFKCQQCDKAYNLYKTLLQHKRECHSEKSNKIFKCEKCDKIFKTGIILKQHLANKHSDQKEAMRSICEQCGFIAAHQYSLSRHIINKHTETDQIKCDQCPKIFKTRYSLKYHVIGNHNPSNIKPFKCPECQMAFTRKTLLNQHKRTHLKYTERIKCDFEGCDVRFVKHGDKTHHMRLVHLKVKQHVCDFCGEAFGAMQTLRHHRFIHTGEKPYKCNVCGQGFRQRTAMKTHRKTHLGKETKAQDLIDNLPEINLSLVANISS